MKAAGLVEIQYLIWAKGSLVLGHADYQWQHEPCFYAARDGDTPSFYGDRTQTTVWQLASRTDGSRTIALGQGLLFSDGAGHELYITPNPPKNRKLRNVRLAPDETATVLAESGLTDVWQVRRDTATAEHPTQKPVELAERALQNSSRAGDVVVDAFLGSGTTLIAAERLGRRCFGMELEPRYVDLAVRRWEDFTGLEAERENKSADSP
jgi:DNA modification methylase